MVTTSDNAGVPSMRFSWTKPAENGSPVTAYELQIRAQNGSFLATTECDGSDLTVVSNMYCDVLMATLRANFSLSKGDPIIAQVRAKNAVGWAATFSPANSGMTVVVQDKPDAPASAPTSSA